VPMWRVEGIPGQVRAFGAVWQQQQHIACVVPVWCICGACVVHMWCLCGAYVVHVWCIYM
jgi:hypothetical protein